MNDLSIKPANAVDAGTSKPSTSSAAAALAGLSSSFQDLLGKTGVNFDKGLGGISEKAGISAIGENTARDYTDERPADPHDDRQDRVVDRGGDDRADRDRNEPARADRNDDDVRDTGAPDRDDHRDTGERREPRDDQSGDKPAHAERPDRDDRQGEGQTADQDRGTEQSNTAAANDKENTGSEGAANGKSGDAGQQVRPGAEVAQGVVPLQALNAAAVISAVGGTSQSTESVVADTGKTANVAGLASAASGREQAGNHAGQAATGQNQGQGQQNQAANAAAQQTAATQQNQNTAAQQQAQQLAQTLGQDARVKVDVAVTQDAETLSSRPTATLTASSVVASDAKAQGQSTQQSGQTIAGQNNHAAVAANAQQAQGGQTQAQNQQAGGQANQATSALLASADAKGPGAGAGTAHGASATAGGESANSANSATANAGTQQTQQTQQAQQTQANNAARAQQTTQSSVVEQVSVKIAKAVQSGSDRITIRLNPAELGRVDVKLELAADGRTTAVVTADNRETLDLLRRDSSDLQKALEEGGLQLSDNDLNFNLRGEESETAENGEDGKAAGAEDEDLADGEPEVIVAHEGGVLANGRIDVRA